MRERERGGAKEGKVEGEERAGFLKRKTNVQRKGGRALSIGPL